MSKRTEAQVLEDVTQEYIESLDITNLPSLYDMIGELMARTIDEYELENSVKAKGQKWPIPRDLQDIQIALMISAIYPICCIACAGYEADPAYDLLGVYMSEGDNRGLYVTDDTTIQRIIRQFRSNIRIADINEVISEIRSYVPRRFRCTIPHLIAVNNGIFDYTAKKLWPFTHKLVFLSKSRVDYDAYALNPIIHNDEDGTDWDVETWMESLSDDPEIVQVFWEILGAIIRPHVRWNKSAWLYSESGNNGKGTLCELMRALCGPGTYASIPLSNFSKDFMLEPLTRATAIIVDENDVGTYIDRAANLKAVITNDVIQINRKNKMPISYQFYGFMVQCLNELPKIKDRSDSFFRRQLFIPMTKCFTGKERKYIKNEYLHRKDVLQYVLHRVLNMDYDTLSEPEACKAALADYKEFNDPVRRFANEIMPELVWDLAPFTFLYDLFVAWFKRRNPGGCMPNYVKFVNNLYAMQREVAGGQWSCDDKKRQIRPKNLMDKDEPLATEYKLWGWVKPNNCNVNVKHFLGKAHYTGMLRRQPQSGVAPHADP